MYGGVATPLALLHQNSESTRPKHIQTSGRASCSRDDSFGNGGGNSSSSYSVIPRVVSSNAPRLPPLRESSNRETAHNGENEPLLPSSMAAKGQSSRQPVYHKKNIENDLPPPPLPPHKNSIQVVNMQKQNCADMRYIPPWPRGPNPESVRQQNHSNINAYVSNTTHA